MAGVEIADAWVSIKPSARGLKDGLTAELKGAGLETVAKEQGDKAAKSFGERFEQSTGQSLGNVAKKSMLAAAAIGGGLMLAANAAGDLEAAISANEQVLGDVSKGIQSWAKSSVQNFGLSERAAIDAATSFGAIGKVAGLAGAPLGKFSQDLVGLAADMAAFANVPVAQTLQDLQGGFAGQTEVLRKYKVYLDDAGLKAALFAATGEKVTGTLTAQQRIVATNAEIWRQTADQQGQAAREADGLARAQDNFKATLENTAASIGKSVLPAMTGLLQGLTDGIGLVGSFNDATGGLVGQLGMFAVAGLGAVGAVAGIGSKVSGLVKGFGDMSAGMQKASLAAGGLTIAVTVGLAIWEAMGAKQRAVEARTRELTAALPALYKETWNAAEAAKAHGQALDGVAIGEKALTRAILETGESGEAVVAMFGDLGVSSERALAVIGQIRKDGPAGLNALAQAAGIGADKAALLARALTDSNSNWLDVTAAFVRAGAAAGLSREEVARLWQELQPAAHSLRDIQDAAGRTDLDAMAGRMANVSMATNDASVALGKQAKANLEAQGVAAEGVALYNEFNRLLAALPEDQRNVVRGIEDLTGAQKGLNMVQANTLSLTSKTEDAFKQAADKADAFKSALDRLIGGQLGLQAAQDELVAGIAEVDKVIADAKAGIDGASTSLDVNTEAGRANREMMRGRAEAIVSSTTAALEQGASVELASAAMKSQIEVLRGQLIAFGLSEQAADDYIKQLGLTPDNVTTAVKLAEIDVAKRQLEDHKADIEALPKSQQTLIQTLIDQGDYLAAKRALDNLQMPRTVYYNIRKGENVMSAWGNYFSKPGFTSIAEDGDPEAVLTLGKPANLRRQLSDPRIGGPVLAALGDRQSGDGVSVSSGGLSSGDRLVIVVEGQPLTAVVRERDRELAGSLMAGRR